MDDPTPMTFAGPADPQMPPRCLRCSYPLSQLAEPRCPECGRPFDPADPATFTRHPSFLWWKYWLPGVGMAAVAGLASFALFLGFGQLGWGFTLATPTMIGALVGYGVRARWIAVAAAAMPVLGGVVLATVIGRAEGAFCGAILGGVAVVPLLFGAVVGYALRQTMKNSRFSQRWYLPVIGLLLLPAVADVAERAIGRRPAAVEQVSTSAVVPLPADQAWHSRLNRGRPADDGPYRLGLVRPDGGGGSTAVGGSFVSRFTGGATAVRITRRIEGHELDWTFVTQAHVEDRAVRLLDGRMTFDSAGPTQTGVTVTTRYQPLMTPRWAWRPVEQWVGDATHRQVMAEMTPR